MTDVPGGAPPVLIVQPPFVQLNAPYPAPYYLRAFLEARGIRTAVADHSIGLFGRIFSRDGLRAVFDAARPSVEERLARPAAGKRREEEAIRENLARYLSQEELWTAAIDRTVAFLRGEDREFGHLLSAANGALPAGDRTLRFIDSVGKQPSPDDARRVASCMLADLADFIAAAADPGFSLVRYAESLAASVRRFADVEAALDGWTLRSFYAPLLEEEWDRAEHEFAPTEARPLVLACTVPFPGCLAGALAAARSAKAHFGARVLTVAGGGYVNTELRSIRSTAFFDYFDFLSFDRGYGSLSAILDEVSRSRPAAGALYKTVYRSGADGTLVGSPDQPPSGKPEASAMPTASAVPEADYARLDAESPAVVFPDYRGVDFSRYILPVDDENPMHRLWSDGRWMKAYLAHGCYWAACAFCDVQLDYIRGYLPVDVDALFAHLVSQAAATGVRGVHLVDEAAPVAALLRLAELNRAAGLPLVFWGNIRFERAFTPDIAAALAAGGLLGVSAGIEIASERGFKRLGKGIGLPDVVRSCAAFKEAGILVHAYLIFGFWDETDGEILDSAETMRQLFAAGLVDSAFWHKFVLTRHSRVMRERKKGRHPELEPIAAEGGDLADGDFADNDLRFRGEDRFDRWSAPLDGLTAAWMAGESLDRPVAEGIPFPVPAPTVPPDLAESLLDGYARDRDADREAFPGNPAGADGRRAVFLGSRPVAESLADGRVRLRWTFRLQDHSVDLPPTAATETLRLLRAGPQDAFGFADAGKLAAELQAAIGKKAFPGVWRALREGGLVLLPEKTP